MNHNTFKIFIFFIFFAVFLNHYKAYPQGWSDLTVSSLPDASFALVEVDKNRNKVRHLPYRDMNGNIDIEQLIYCLGSFSHETWIAQENKALARENLEEHYSRFKLEQLKEEIKEPININRATLMELVWLHNIGPVTAVKIYKFRETNGPFQNIEEIINVEGIGPATFAGIRYYIGIR